MCVRCHDRHHPEAKECPRAKQRRVDHEIRDVAPVHHTAPATTSAATSSPLGGFFRGQNVFNFFKDSADNLEAALSAANPAKTFSARTTASNPASGPALDRVPFGRTEKVKQGPRGPGKAKEKKEDDEDFEWRVREEVARRLEVERRVREEMREKERHNAGEEAMLQPAANQALPEAAEGEEVDDEWWQITDEPKPNAATNPIPIPSIPEKTTAVATLK